MIETGLYRHYKGGLYVVPFEYSIKNSTNKANSEQMILYYSLTTKDWYVREEQEFNSMVEIEGGNFVRRFELLRELKLSTNV